MNQLNSLSYLGNDAGQAVNVTAANSDLPFYFIELLRLEIPPNSSKLGGAGHARSFVFTMTLGASIS